jgi:hypothetical protein
MEGANHSEEQEQGVVVPPSPSKRPGTFSRADPRIAGGRKPGQVNRSTRAAQQLLESQALEIVQRALKIALDEKDTEDQAKPCPFCKRGMPRSEELTSRMLIALMDRIKGLGLKSKLDIPEGAIKITKIENVIVDPRNGDVKQLP